jgi:hypothetical protein
VRHVDSVAIAHEDNIAKGTDLAADHVVQPLGEPNECTRRVKWYHQGLIHLGEDCEHHRLNAHGAHGEVDQRAQDNLPKRVEVAYPFFFLHFKKKMGRAKHRRRKMRGRGLFSDEIPDPKSRPGFPGEKHAIRLSSPFKGSSYNWMGPGTNIAARLARHDPGINQADEIAKKHDLAYYHMKSEHDPEKRKQIEIKADEDAINEWRSSADKARAEVRLAIGAILAKMDAQRAGLVKYGIFSSNPE